MAHALDKQGWSLILAGRNQSKLERLAVQFEQAKPVILPPLSSSVTPEQWLKIIKPRVTNLKLVVHAAGSGRQVKLADLNYTDFKTDQAVHLDALLALYQIAYQLRGKGDFNLVCFGSASTDKAWPKNGSYGTIKAGVRYLAQVMQSEIKSDGGRVLCVEAGSVNTGFFATLKNHLPPEKMIQPDQLADWVLCCLDLPDRLWLEPLRLRSD